MLLDTFCCKSLCSVGYMKHGKTIVYFYFSEVFWCLHFVVGLWNLALGRSRGEKDELYRPPYIYAWVLLCHSSYICLLTSYSYEVQHCFHALQFVKFIKFIKVTIYKTYESYNFYLYDACLTQGGQVTDANNCTRRKNCIYNVCGISQAGGFTLARGFPWDVG